MWTIILQTSLRVITFSRWTRWDLLLFTMYLTALDTSPWAQQYHGDYVMMTIVINYLHPSYNTTSVCMNKLSISVHFHEVTYCNIICWLWALSLPQLTPVNTSVGRIEATDIDSEPLYYRLESATLRHSLHHRWTLSLICWCCCLGPGLSWKIDRYFFLSQQDKPGINKGSVKSLLSS